MKIGVNLRIDVTKIDKSRIFVGQKGKYLDLVSFIDTENVSEYGDNGIVSQSVSQEERQSGVKLPILGNSKVFYTDGGQAQQQESGYVNQDVPDDGNIPF